MKTCRACKKKRVARQFSVDARAKDGRNGRCKSCAAEATAVWRSKNPKKAIEGPRKWRKKNPLKAAELTRKWIQKNSVRHAVTVQKWKRRNPSKVLSYKSKWRAANKAAISRKARLKNYGLSSSDFLSLIESQSNRCRICSEKFLGKCIPCVDHDHATGKVRGLLCRKCNVALGLLGDSPSRLIAAAAYLQKDALTNGG